MKLLALALTQNGISVTVQGEGPHTYFGMYINEYEGVRTAELTRAEILECLQLALEGEPEFAAKLKTLLRG